MDEVGSANPYAPPAAPLDPAPPPAAQAALEGYRPLTTLAQVLTAVMGLLILHDLAEIGHQASVISVMGRVIAGEEVPQASLEAIDQRSVILSVSLIALTIAAVVLFCLVMARGNRNARAFNRMPVTFTPGWAAGYFFVPVLSLWKPFQVMKEIWRASEPHPDPRLDLSFTEVSGLVPAWWAAYVLHAIVGQVSLRMNGSLANAQDFVRAAWVDVISSVVSIMAALLAAALVRALSRRQDECARAIAGA
jgi:hypothetical protein